MSTSDLKTCFVVGPIGAADSAVRLEADWLLEGIIRPVLAKRPDFRVVRADKVDNPGMIDSQIINMLLDAELVIADLTGLNPNAFYEIGIRHMSQKPIIHIFPPALELPFDVKPFRSIPFTRTSPADLDAARIALEAQINAVLATGYEVENPVTRARGRVQLQEHATPEMRIILDQFDDLSRRLATIENISKTKMRSTPAERKEERILSIYFGDNSDVNRDLKKSLVESVLLNTGQVPRTMVSGDEGFHLLIAGAADPVIDKSIKQDIMSFDSVVSAEIGAIRPNFEKYGRGAEPV